MKQGCTVQSCFIVQENPAPGTGFGKAYGGKAYNMRNSIAAITTFFTPVWVEHKMHRMAFRQQDCASILQPACSKGSSHKNFHWLNGQLDFKLAVFYADFFIKTFHCAEI